MLFAMSNQEILERTGVHFVLPFSYAKQKMVSLFIGLDVLKTLSNHSNWMK